MITEQIEDREVLLRDTSLSQVTYLHVSVYMYDLSYSRGLPLVTSHGTVSTDYMTTVSIHYTTAVLQVLNENSKVLLFFGRRRLEAV